MSTDALSEMFKRYQDELKGHFDQAKSRAEGLQTEVKEWVGWAKNEAEARKEQFQPILMEKKKELEEMVKDQSPLQVPSEHEYIRDNYGWLAICFAGFTVGQIVGQILTPIVGAAFNSTVALLTYLLLPAYFWLFQRKTEMTESKRRAVNLSFSAILGACLSFLFSEVQFAFYVPPTFVFPLAISVMNGVTQAPSRTAWLGGAIGAGVGGCMVYGFAMGLPVLYLLFVAAYAGLAFVDLQIKIGRLRASQAQCAAIEQMFSIFGHAVFISLMHILFAQSRDQPVDEPPPSSK